MAEWLKPSTRAKKQPMSVLTAKYGVSKQAVYRAISKGAPAVKRGRPTALTREEEAELVAFIVAQQEQLRSSTMQPVLMRVRPSCFPRALM
jgi:hypothetical protein